MISFNVPNPVSSVIDFVQNFHKKKPSKSTKGTTSKPTTTVETTEPEEEIEEPAGDAATEVTKKYARRGRKANILAGAMGGMNMERIRRRRMLGSFSEPMGQY
jgi:hypothetical protein